MKKLFLGAAITMSALSFAQSFGIKGGGNITTVSGLENIAAKYNFGWNAGAFVNIPVNEKFSIQPEVLYNTMGAMLNSDEPIIGSEVEEVNWKLNYISVPVMFQYNATPKFYVEAGPQFSYMLLSKFKSNNLTTKNNADDLNKFDFGVGAGLGYWITPNLGVNARYVAGITDITKDNESDKKVRNNNNVQVGLAFRFK